MDKQPIRDADCGQNQNDGEESFVVSPHGGALPSRVLFFILQKKTGPDHPRRVFGLFYMRGRSRAHTNEGNNGKVREVCRA